MDSKENEQRKVIFTYGDYIYHPNDIISLAKRIQINCIINLCVNENNIEDEIKKHNILYGGFWKYFKEKFPDVSDKHGQIIYEQAIQNESIIHGIERIKNGIDKGYRIMLLDHEPDTKISPRYTLIGKYLTPDYLIIHAITPIYYLTQEQLQRKIQERNEANYQKKIEAARLGTKGEELAGLYLMQHNFRILDHNWNLHRGCEIDIIAFKDNRLHFVEVKTRSSDKYGEPQLAITEQKMRNIKKAALKYRSIRGMYNLEYQIDTIAIIYRSPTDYDLKYFPDVQQFPVSRNYNLPYRNH